MKFLRIFRFEFAYQAQSISTWIYFVVLFLTAIFLNILIEPGDKVYSNAPYFIANLIIFGGLIWLVIGAPISGEAAARDVQTRMLPLTYTTPVTKLDYLGGRFLAALAVNSLLILSLPLGLLLSYYLPGFNQEGLGPFRASAYLSVYFLISLPNVFVATALQFCFSALRRNVVTSYIASLLLAILAQIIAVSVAKLFGNWDLVKLLDPVGIAGIVNSELGTWTPAEKNTRLITLEGMFLWNRVLWFSIALAALLLTYIRFNFAHVETRKGWKIFQRWQHQDVTETLNVGLKAITLPHVQRSINFGTHLRQAFTIAQASFKIIARHPLGLSLVGLFTIVSAVFASNIMSLFGIPLIPTTQQVLTYLATPVGNVGTPLVFIPLLIIYFAGEIVWSERDANLGDIADATPVPEWALLAGKFIGLGLAIIIWMALLMIGGIFMQLGMDYYHFELGLYLKALFGLQLVDYLLFALLCLVVHVMVNQKYIGYTVMLLIFFFFAFPSRFGVEHSMLIFGSDPGWWYTDMRGFGKTIGPWLWFKVYWIAWALLLAVAARVLWPRGKEQSVQYRLRQSRRRFTKQTRWIAVTALVFILIPGSFIFYNTNVLNEYVTSSEVNKRKAEYEKRYGKYRKSPRPQLVGTKLLVEIYPELEQVEIRAAYTLVNNEKVSIDSIHVGSFSGIVPEEIEFSRDAAGVLIDEKLSHYIYKLQEPLRPQDSLKLRFVVSYTQRAFRHSGTNTSVLVNGTYLTNYDILPSIGYQPYREINDAVTRKKYNLAARTPMPSLYDPEARNTALTTDRNAFEAIVGTSKNEVAVAPGNLQRTWTEGDRSYYHFKTHSPIRGEYAILSGDYILREDKWYDIAIRIYHHPLHGGNIDRMLRSVKASLGYYTEQFGPYPYDHITVVEHAGSEGGLSSEASMVDYGEPFALMNPDDSENGFDLPYYIIAHEVAHQWFGGAQIKPANVEGAGVLIEGLAVYAGMQVLEKSYGDHHVRQYVNFLHSNYEMPRVLSTPSLLQANESFLYYRKGGLAMYALSKYIGKEEVNAALRTLLQKHNTGNPSLLTTLDLYHELKNRTPDSLHYLIKDLFERNTYWRLKTDQFTASKTEAGDWEVSLKIQASKMVTDTTGRDTDIPMNDWLEVGIYEEGKGLHSPLYLQMHRIRTGEQTIKVTVPGKPDYGGIDPNHLMIDLKVNDNTMRLNEEGVF